MPETIKNYLSNVLLAIRGINPFRKEMEGVKKQCEDALNRVKYLDSIYNNVCATIAGAERRIKDYQRLVENLRERINEKDTLMEQIKRDYQKRIADYVALVDELKTNAATNNDA